MVRARITRTEAKIMCFFYSRVLFNGRMIVRTRVCGGTDWQSEMTVRTFKTQLGSLLIRRAPLGVRTGAHFAEDVEAASHILRCRAIHAGSQRWFKTPQITKLEKIQGRASVVKRGKPALYLSPDFLSHCGRKLAHVKQSRSEGNDDVV